MDVYYEEILDYKVSIKISLVPFMFININLVKLLKLNHINLPRFFSLHGSQYQQNGTYCNELCNAIESIYSCKTTDFLYHQCRQS